MNHDKGEIIDEQVFIDMVHSRGINPIQLKEPVKLFAQLQMTEEDFLDYAKTKDKEVFYYYEYPSDSEILITGDTFDNASGELRQIISDLQITCDFDWFLDDILFPENKVEDEEIEEDFFDNFTEFERQLQTRIITHDHSIDMSQYRIPRSFMAACIVQGCVIGITKTIKKPPMTVAEEALLNILNDYKQEAAKQKERTEQKEKEIKEKLRAFLLESKEFRLSRNKALREEFGEDLWNKTEYDWIKDAFKKSYYGHPPKDYYLFLERVYNELKYSYKW